MKKFLLAAASCCLLFAACKKKDDPSRAELLSNGKWRMTALKATANFLGRDTSIDLLAAQMVCMADNYTIFNSDGRLITDEGPTMCMPGSPQQTDAGTWSLADGDANLVLSGGLLSGKYKINTLDGSTLQVQRDTTVAFNAGGINLSLPVKAVATFSHTD